MRLARFHDAELGLSDHFDSQWCQQAPEFAQLAAIARGEHEAPDHDAIINVAAMAKPSPAHIISSAVFCAPINSPIPRSASTTSMSISKREKVAPSAVP